MRPASRSRPSETSIIAVAPASARAGPAFSGGTGARKTDSDSRTAARITSSKPSHDDETTRPLAEQGIAVLPSSLEEPTMTRIREAIEAAGLVFSGTSPDNNLVEFVELPRDEHPYYISTQAHPELRSRPTRPHPLFKGLVGAAISRQRELRFPIDETGLRREPVEVDD